MRPLPARIAWLLVLVPVSLLPGCCHCKPVAPQPCAEFRECRHPRLAEMDLCLGGCPPAGTEEGTACRRVCCGMSNDVVGATVEEKAALRACIPVCR
jgi:hypothetical protein